MSDPMCDMTAAFAGQAQAMCPCGQVYVGPLPTGRGVSVNMEEVSVKSLLDGSQMVFFTLALRCKHGDMLAGVRALWEIQQGLAREERYPAGDGWRVLSVRACDMPRVTRREPDGMWIAQSAVCVGALFFRQP